MTCSQKSQVGNNGSAVVREVGSTKLIGEKPARVRNYKEGAVRAGGVQGEAHHRCGPQLSPKRLPSGREGRSLAPVGRRHQKRQ